MSKIEKSPKLEKFECIQLFLSFQFFIFSQNLDILHISENMWDGSWCEMIKLWQFY